MLKLFQFGPQQAVLAQQLVVAHGELPLQQATSHHCQRTPPWRFKNVHHCGSGHLPRLQRRELGGLCREGLHWVRRGGGELVARDLGTERGLRGFGLLEAFAEILNHLPCRP